MIMNVNFHLVSELIFLMAEISTKAKPKDKSCTWQ
jgi:hypothetical protein